MSVVSAVVPRNSESIPRGATAFLAISAGLISFASLEFMLVEIQSDFSMSPDATIVVSQVSAGACLFAVFLAGALSDRLGDRRVMTWACMAYCVGALVVGLSPHVSTLMIGLSISGIGAIVMAIVGLSALNKSFPAGSDRARAFGAFAVIAPVVSIVTPLLVSVIIPHSSWRVVTILWIIVGLVTAASARRSFDVRSENAVASELLTPTFAGVSLSATALAFSFFSLSPRAGNHFQRGSISGAVAAVSFVALIVMMRRLPNPTLDIRSARVRGSLSILAAHFVVNGVNLFFFTYLFLQYRYHQTLLETAVLLIVPQLTATFGALLGGQLCARFGSWRVASWALAAASIASLSTLLVGVGASAWMPVITLSIAAVPIAAAVGPMTQAFMDLAPPDGAGAASSVRNASVNLGIAIAGLISGTIIFDRLDADTELTIEAYGQQADAFHLAGAICCGCYLVAAVLVVVHARRRQVRFADVHGH